MTEIPAHAVADGPLLGTKLYIPRWRSGLVARPRLVERLNQGAERKLTLVSAPAGFGKSTVLAEWIATAVPATRSVAWVSLDPQDNDAARFWSYVVAALRIGRPSVGEDALALLRSSQPVESALTTLINDLAAIEQDVVLILDDFHAIEARPIHQAVDFLLDHLPPRLHLVIASRSDPPLTLARLRARGELTELRAADLRFTVGEAAAFLNEAMGLPLSAEDVAALEVRTEGWIAGLQLAGLSLQGRDDASGFIRAFSGDHRYVVDYLVEEVLRRQPESIRSFLLQTSILERLSGPLCDAVTGRHDSQDVLVQLERGNLFVVPLDDSRQWFRYHHLFGDVLRVHALAEDAEGVPPRHLRASTWYEQQDRLPDAVRHALAAGDFERTADLIERALPVLRPNRQEATVLGWLKMLPDDVIRRRPVLSVAYAWVLLATGRLEGVEERLRDAERRLDGAGDAPERWEAGSDQMVVASDAEFRRLPGVIIVYRAGQALARGDVTQTVNHAQRALDLVPEEDHLVRGSASGLLGLAFWTQGELEAAHRAYALCQQNVLREGYVSDALGCALALADIRIEQGRLGEAMRTFEQGLALATEQGDPALRGTADMYAGMSELRRERNELEAAERLMQRSQELGERAGLPQNPCRRRMAMAGLRQAEGDLEGALGLLDEAERLYAADFFPNVRPVAALKARLWLTQGRLDDAVAWTRDRGLTAEDELSYLREFEHVTLARVLLARSRRDHDEDALREAKRLLERLLRAAEAGERTGSVIEILILRALAHQGQGETSTALAPLKRALTLAEPEGFVRIFVDEGQPMVTLLQAAATRGIAPRYVQRLLMAFGRPESKQPIRQDLIEPLSERELDVLRLLGSDLGGPDIANELMVSLNTLRTHTKNIYSKLGVNSRRAAVRRAGELALLSRASRG